MACPPSTAAVKGLAIALNLVNLCMGTTFFILGIALAWILTNNMAEPVPKSLYVSVAIFFVMMALSLFGALASIFGFHAIRKRTPSFYTIFFVLLAVLAILECALLFWTSATYHLESRRNTTSTVDIQRQSSNDNRDCTQLQQNDQSTESPSNGTTVGICQPKQKGNKIVLNFNLVSLILSQAVMVLMKILLLPMTLFLRRVACGSHLSL